MKKIMLFLVGTLCCLWLTGCATPGPYSTGAGCHPDPVVLNPVQATVATGASILEKIFHHGRYYHQPGVAAPHVYRTPVVYPLPPLPSRPYIYR